MKTKPPPGEVPIVFSINVILPIERDGNGAEKIRNRFIRAGDPSPYHTLEEVPLAFRAYVGRPAEPPPLPMSVYDESPDPYGHLDPSLAELLRRKSVEEHEAAQELARLATVRAEQEQKVLAEGLAERLREADAAPNYHRNS
jgi:hypothetical protein